MQPSGSKSKRDVKDVLTHPLQTRKEFTSVKDLRQYLMPIPMTIKEAHYTQGIPGPFALGPFPVGT